VSSHLRTVLLALVSLVVGAFLASLWLEIRHEAPLTVEPPEGHWDGRRIRVEVLNGAGVDRLAVRATERLRELDFDVVFARHHALGQGRGSIADIDLSAADVVLPAVERGLFGETGHRVFGRGIGDRVGARRMRGDRAVVDNTATARILRLHDLDRFLRAQEYTGQIGGYHVLPGIEWQLLELHRVGPPIGRLLLEQDVEPDRNFRFQLFEQSQDRLALRHVGRHRERLHAGGLDRGGGLLERRGAPAGEHHIVASLGERNGHRLAHSGSRARYQGDFRLRAHRTPFPASVWCARNSIKRAARQPAGTAITD